MSSSHAFEAPHGETETFIAQVWSELLGVERVGRQDDFFELGGHSVLAMGMLSRLRSTLDADVSLTELFRRSQLIAFAEAVTNAKGTASAAAGSGGVHQGEIPLSSAQERIWFMEQMSPGGCTYHLHWALRLAGPLVPAALEQALREVQRRHDVLRSVFVATESGPVQIVRPYTGGTFERFDISAMEPAVRERALTRMTLEHARAPFNLQEGPPLRVHLIRLALEDWALCVNMHHLVSDGWSLDRFFQDVSAYYTAFISGEQPRLEALTLQYSEVALAQRARLEEPQLQNELEYWKRQLRQPLQPQQLEPDFPRPATPSYVGRMQTQHFPPAVLSALNTLSRDEGVTLFVTLVSAFNVLLHRQNGNEEIVVGTDIANRTRAGVQPMLGLFVNQLVLRADLSARPTFREVLHRVRRIAVDALAHQEIPFDRLVHELTTARDPGSNPLFQIMFLLHSATPAGVRFPGLRVAAIEVPVEASPFDLTISFGEMPSGELRMDWRYRADIFKDSTIARLMSHLDVLLASVLANPDCRIDELDVLPAAEVAERESARLKQKASKLEKLLATRPRQVDASVDGLVLVEPPAQGRSLPLVVRPATDGILLDRFVREQGAWIAARLQKHGGILFRGFKVDSPERLNELTAALTPGALDYSERSSPRTRIRENVFTSTDHPPDQPIVLHNEQSYTLNWPMKIIFCCLQPAARGGNTPIADSRRVLTRLSARTVSMFEERGITYVRNYGQGLGLPWKVAFQTDDQNVVEAQCAAAQIEFEWLSGGRLRTRQRRQAIRLHPVTGERVWFNHAFFFNVASLDRALRDELIRAAGEDNLPFQTYFGDGGAIADDVLEDIRSALAAETVSFPWQVGDLLLLDNMLAAHGREPYSGARRIAVTMAEPYQSVVEREGARSV